MIGATCPCGRKSANAVGAATRNDHVAAGRRKVGREIVGVACTKQFGEYVVLNAPAPKPDQATENATPTATDETQKRARVHGTKAGNANHNAPTTESQTP